MAPIDENVPRRDFRTRRPRAILSIRRKRDLVWVLLTVIPFVVAATLLVFKVRLRAPAVEDPAATVTPAP